MNSRWWRVARGATAAASATFVAAFSHTIAGGRPPSAFGVAVSLVLSVALCTMLTGRTVALWRLVVSVGVSQFLFHGLFSGLGTPVPAAHEMAAMGVDAAAPAHHNTPAMWLAHALAAVITILALRYAGSTFWGVADTARLLLARLVSVVVPVTPGPHPRTPAVGSSFLPRDLSLLLSPMRHRGPPMELA